MKIQFVILCNMTLTSQHNNEFVTQNLVKSFQWTFDILFCKKQNKKNPTTEYVNIVSKVAQWYAH